MYEDCNLSIYLLDEALTYEQQDMDYEYTRLFSDDLGEFIYEFDHE